MPWEIALPARQPTNNYILFQSVPNFMKLICAVFILLALMTSVECQPTARQGLPENDSSTIPLLNRIALCEGAFDGHAYNFAGGYDVPFGYGNGIGSDYVISTNESINTDNIPVVNMPKIKLQLKLPKFKYNPPKIYPPITITQIPKYNLSEVYRPITITQIPKYNLPEVYRPITITQFLKYNPPDPPVTPVIPPRVSPLC